MQVWMQGDAMQPWGHRIVFAGDAGWKSALCTAKSEAMTSRQEHLL